MASKSPYMRGRRPLSNAPGGGTYAEKWHQKLDYLEKPKRGKPKEIRMVGGVFTIFQHFVRFKRKDGSKGGFYEVCPDFDWDTGEFRKGPDAVCPLCADFQADDLPQELRLLGSFRYYFDAFDVTAAKDGRKDVFGVVFTNKYGKNDLAMIGDIMNCELDDPEKGTSVLWHFDEKAPDPKDRVRFYQGNKMAVRFNEDKGLWMMKGGGTVFTGEPTPYDEIVEVKDAEAIRADLKRLGLYSRLEEVLEVVASREEPGSDRRRSSSGGGDEGGSWGDESAPEPEPEKPKRGRGRPKGSKNKAKAEEAAPPKDEAWGDGGSTESAPAETGWGEESSSDSSSAEGGGWGDEGGTTASADEGGGWGDEGGNGKSTGSSDSWGDEGGSSEASSESTESAPEFDDSLFGDEGWGGSPSEDSSKESKDTKEEDDPSGW